MQQKNYDTVTEAMTDLKKLGYTVDFSMMTERERLICHRTKTELSPNDFEIDHFFRFEGESDPGDSMIVYAISSKNKKLKGIVVNAYGVYAENTSSAIVEKLNAHPEQGNVDVIDTITHYFKNQNDEKEVPSPKGTCPVCWGHQQYDGKIKDLLKDKQIDINNHKDSYMVIQNFMKDHIDGIKMKEGIETDCPNCSNGLKKEKK